MEKNILIKEDPIDVAVMVNATIVEFDKPYDTAYFENRYEGKTRLILVAYADDRPAGYMVSYDKDSDGSFYCWMAGVDPLFRRSGILRKLMRYLESWAVNHGYDRITIKTRNNRREMLAFLVDSGFYFIEVQLQPSVEDNRVLLEKKIK